MLAYKITYPTNQWEDLLHKLESGDADLDTVVKKFTDQLRLDEKASREDKPVTDCGLSAPRRGLHIDKLTEIGKYIAFALYPPKDKSRDNRIMSYVLYSQTISILRRKFIKQTEDEFNKNKKIKAQLKVDYIQKNFCTLKDKLPQCMITHPTAMPVDVAPIEELEDFFNHMKKNISTDKEFLEFTRGAHYSDGRIDLCKQVVGEPWIQQLMDSIKDNNYVQHFLLGNNIIDYTGAQAIANFISSEHVPEIETWYIAGNRIDEKGIELIANTLKTDTDAKSLWLKRNPLNPLGIKHIADMLKVNTTLETLDLLNTNMGDEGTKYIFEALKVNTGLKRLYLGANNITAIGAKYIADYFYEMAARNKIGLQSLWLDMNRLSDDGVILVADALKEYKHMERLALGSNRMTAVGAKVLFKVMRYHKNLIMLDIGMYKATGDMGELPNNLKDEGVKHITDFIENNNYLKVLDITQNSITEAGMNKIAESMKKNNTLLYIYYDQYGSNLSKTVKTSMKETMERNIKVQLNISFKDFHKKNLRLMKHTPDILKIDSIYRNRM
jgi:Ran GTPase-activating protein (RanGAP) involved in mRNA processing and transport